jgi:hypothetical protein
MVAAAEGLRAAAQPSRVLRATAPRVGSDRGWLVGSAVLLVVLCGLPYLLASLFGPKDLERIGTFWFMRDFSQYQAAMREGASQTSWLIHDHFSAEGHTPALMYPLYVAAGKFAALVHVSDLGVFTALEWLGRLAVLGAVYVFAATFLAESRQRKLAVALALGTLGLDTFAALLRNLLEALGANGVAHALPETINPFLEVSSFGALLSAPHLMFGLALTLVCAPLYLRAIASGRRGWDVALLGGTVLILSLVHSFNAPVLVSVLVAHAVLSGKRAWPAGIVAAAAAAPMALYSLVLYATDPFWSGTYNAQNLMPSPPPWLLPLDFGVVLLGAPLAWRVVARWPVQRRNLILLWIGAGLIWMYAPVPYQRRFAFGMQPALAVLAAVGLWQLQGWMAARRTPYWRIRLVNYSVIVGATATSMLVYLALLASAMNNKPAEVYLWTHAEASSADWLSSNSSAADVVLASTDYSNALAGVIDGRVVQGHIVATLHSDAKSAMLDEFFSSGATTEQRSRLLAETGATLVAFGPRERALGAASLADQPDLRLIYDEDGIQLFRVAR